MKFFFFQNTGFFSAKIDLKDTSSNAMIFPTFKKRFNVFFLSVLTVTEGFQFSKLRLGYYRFFYTDARKKGFVTELKKASSKKGSSNELLLLM